MELNRRISRRLHEEHHATLGLWGRLEASLAAGRHDAALLKSAAAALERELERHFRFEEEELFPRLAAAGEGDIGELLREEHDAIRSAGRSFIALAKDDLRETEVRMLGLELAERLVSHVQKEEMALLPALEDFIDEETDHELDSAYAAA